MSTSQLVADAFARRFGTPLVADEELVKIPYDAAAPAVELVNDDAAISGRSKFRRSDVFTGSAQP